MCNLDVQCPHCNEIFETGWIVWDDDIICPKCDDKILIDVDFYIDEDGKLKSLYHFLKP